MSAPGETSQQTVHVFTDEQFKQLLATVKPTSTVAQVGSVVQTGVADVLANIKQLIADAEGTVGHVHGAAKQLQADVKANRWQLIIGAAAFASLAFQVLPVIMRLAGH